MSRDELLILKMLEVLSSMPDGQCNAAVLKASVDLLIKPNTLASEFEGAVRAAETQNLVIGIRPRFGAIKWKITDLGRAEHIESSK